MTATADDKVSIECKVRALDDTPNYFSFKSSPGEYTKLTTSEFGETRTCVLLNQNAKTWQCVNGPKAGTVIENDFFKYENLLRFRRGCG